MGRRDLRQEKKEENQELMTEELAIDKTAEEAVMDSLIKQKVEEQLQIMQQDKKKRDLLAKVPSTWRMSERGLASVKKSVALYKTEFGLYASIPMICKGEECIYAELFPDLHEGLSEAGERCPVEVAFILSKYEAYTDELEIEESDAVDMSILRDVIDYDVQIMRAENKMAVEGDFVKDVIVGVNDGGVPITQEQISKAAEYKDKIQVKRNKSLEMLNSTRKDKAGTKLNLVMDPSTYAKKILEGQQNLMVEGIFEDLDIIPDITYDDGSGK